MESIEVLKKIVQKIYSRFFFFLISLLGVFNYETSYAGFNYDYIYYSEGW